VSGPPDQEVTVPSARPLAVTALALLAACSSSPAAPPAHLPTSGASTGSTALGYADNGRTLTVTRGSQVVVTLASTYWTFDALRSRAVVASAPSYHPAGGHRVPGSGAGTVREVLRAQAAGTATVVAHRSSCGEAMRCVGASGTFRVTVVVH
jgi:hypothetical protein